MTAVSRRHQITLPVRLMRDAGIEPGDDIRVRSTGPGRIELVTTEALIIEFAGCLDVETYPTGYLDDLRGSGRG